MWIKYIESFGNFILLVCLFVSYCFQKTKLNMHKNRKKNHFFRITFKIRKKVIKRKAHHSNFNFDYIPISSVYSVTYFTLSFLLFRFGNYIDGQIDPQWIWHFKCGQILWNSKWWNRSFYHPFNLDKKSFSYHRSLK